MIFKKYLCSCALDESTLSIEMVKVEERQERMKKKKENLKTRVCTYLSIILSLAGEALRTEFFPSPFHPGRLMGEAGRRDSLASERKLRALLGRALGGRLPCRSLKTQCEVCNHERYIVKNYSNIQKTTAMSSKNAITVTLQALGRRLPCRSLNLQQEVCNHD